MKNDTMSHHNQLCMGLIVLVVLALTGCQGLNGNATQDSSLGPISSNPGSLTFGNTQVGGSTKLFETLTNTGNSSLTISEANAKGAGFSISGLTLPTTLNPNQSLTFTAIFTPSGTGAVSGSISIVSNSSNSPLNISLSGMGTTQGQLSVAPASLSFGSVTLGSSSSLNASLSAAGTTVTVASATSNSSEFVVSGITLPTTIAAGDSLPFTVTFTPNAAGSATASLIFVNQADNSSTAESLTGNGQAGQAHWVGLTWDASSGAVSYNIYRKLPTDSVYTQIDSGSATTSYTDGNVAAGQTYDYAVTAVNVEEQESGYSNIAQVTVPTS